MLLLIGGIVIALVIGSLIAMFFIIKLVLLAMLVGAGIVYAVCYLIFDSLFQPYGLEVWVVLLATAIVGTSIIWIMARVFGLIDRGADFKRPPYWRGSQKPNTANIPPDTSNNVNNRQVHSFANPKAPCPCGSGKRFENCHGLER